MARRRFMANHALWLLLLPTVLYAQESRGPGNVGSAQTGQFGIRGLLVTDRVIEIPPNLSIRLEKVGGVPVGQTFVNSSNSFEFSGLSPGSYQVTIRHEQFEDVDQRVEIVGRIPHVLFLSILLVPKDQEAKPKIVYPLEDDVEGVIPIQVLAKQISSRAIGQYEKAKEAYGKGQLAKAIQHARRAVQIAPQFYLAHRNLGFYLQQAGQTAWAIEHLKRAIAINEKSSRSHFFLANVFLEQGRFDDAIQEYEITLRLWPDSAATYYYVGHCLYKRQRYAEAEKALKHSLTLDPKNLSPAHLQLANVYIKRAQWGDAYEHLESFLKENPSSPEIPQVLFTMTVMKARMEHSARP